MRTRIKTFGLSEQELRAILEMSPREVIILPSPPRKVKRLISWLKDNGFLILEYEIEKTADGRTAVLCLPTSIKKGGIEDDKADS